MKYLFFSMVLGAGFLFYMTSGQGKKGLPALSLVRPSVPTAATSSSPSAADLVDGDAEPAERMVQIHGKWYKYRADNTYVIDGVPTLHIAKKIEMRRPQPAAQPSPRGQGSEKANADHQKSQKLARMADQNPLSVYTPEGFQALKDGLEAAQNGAAERKKALEELTRDP